MRRVSEKSASQKTPCLVLNLASVTYLNSSNIARLLRLRRLRLRRLRFRFGVVTGTAGGQRTRAQHQRPWRLQ